MYFEIKVLKHLQPIDLLELLLTCTNIIIKQSDFAEKIDR